MKDAKFYNADALLNATARHAGKPVAVRYAACTVCHGVFDATKAGRAEAAACCAEHKAGR